MTFKDLLDQAIAMLQRRGRVTYRTLKLQFQLDDDHLEALKEALIDAERLAVDENGTVLVWRGGADGTPAPGLVATAHGRKFDASVKHVYKNSIKGYSARLTASDVRARHDGPIQL